MSSRIEITPPIGERAITCDHCKAKFYQRANADAILMSDIEADFDCCMVCFNYSGPGCIPPRIKFGLTRTTVAERIPAAEAAGPPTGEQAAMQALAHFLLAGAREGGVQHFVPTNQEPDAGGRTMLGFELAPGAPAEFLAMMEAEHGPLAPVGQSVPVGVPVAAQVPTSAQAPTAVGPRRGPEGGRLCKCLNCDTEYEEFTRTLQIYCSGACRAAPHRHPMYGPEGDEEEGDEEP